MTMVNRKYESSVTAEVVIILVNGPDYARTRDSSSLSGDYKLERDKVIQ